MIQVNQVKANDNLSESIRQAVEGIGGFAEFVKAGETVLLKPNFNTADPPPASSDLDFIIACANLFYAQGAKEVVVGDSSTMLANTEKVMAEKGVAALERLNPPVRMVNFDQGKWIKKKISQGRILKQVSMPKILDQVDRLILLPCCKTHYIARFTGALKLSVALMRPRERMKLHLGQVQEKVAELNTLVHPDLVIMDARKVFITQGPSHGEVREPGLILASHNRVAIDIEAVKIIQDFPGNELAGIKPEDLVQIRYARELGFE